MYNTPFDFDGWLKLHRTDPEALKKFLKEEEEKIIESAPEHLRPAMRRLQQEMDTRRGGTDDHSLVCARAFRTMSDVMFGKGGTQDQWRRLYTLVM
ncbi:MAG: DUF3135 domain-containing protein [Patescibacteria group bacterium]